jgi:glucokinase
VSLLDAVVACAAAWEDDGPVGVALPGVYDRRADRVLLLPNVPGDWSQLAVRGEIAARTGRTVVMCNDARAFAQAELCRGAAAGVSDALFVVLGTGVGGAVLSGGRLCLGWQDRAGEIGHICVDPSGPACGCGARGCLETYIGAAGLVARTREALAVAGRAEPAGVPTTELSAPAILRAAESGDPVASAVVTAAIAAFARGLGAAVGVTAPETVVLGGGLAAGLTPWLDGFAATVQAYARLAAIPTVVLARHGRYAGAIGAALWAERPPV